MNGMKANDLVRGLFEVCGGFVAVGDGEPVCAECGWLDHEHRTAAEVRVLPARPVHRAPKRLAS